MPIRPTLSQPQRAVSFLLVLLLHALLLFAVLHFMVNPQTAVLRNSRPLLEMIINTARPPIPVPAAQRRSPTASPRQQGSAHSGAMPTFTPPAAEPDIKGLGQSLFGCAPENLPNLTPDQRGHCTNEFTRPNDDAVTEPPSHVKDPLRRAAEVRAKNTTSRVPCTTITEVPAGGGNVAAPVVDPLCAVKGLINGFDPLNGLSK
jgi:hypothetical protein